MKRRTFLSLATALLVVGAVLIRTVPSTGNRGGSRKTSVPRSTPSGEIRANVATAYARLPLHFEANEGQTDSQVRFLARGIGHTLFLTDREAVLVLTRTERPAKGTPEQRAETMELVLRMTFVGANPGSRVAGLEELRGKANYFIGRDPAQWRTNVPLYAKVQYADVYPGIDLSYSGDQRQVQYHFVVRPGADPQRIELGWQGVDTLDVDPQGDLVLHTAWGAVRQGKPVVYQELDGARRAIAGGYLGTGAHEVGFAVAAYDASRPLVIAGTVPFGVVPAVAPTVTDPFDLAHSSNIPTR